ncbi:hypothetical protein FB451DRAFT_1169381 [Mycena latifolia]|nr:hypothetical protein FB451DRAFT_1169381 [Mycena latifolia]
MSFSTHITILASDKQLAEQNWPSWHDSLISLVRGKGLSRYTDGMITCPTGVSQLGLPGHGTAVNSRNPTVEEWELHDGVASATIYQNIMDPQAHGIKATITSFEMMTIQSSKFNHTSEVLKKLAMDKLNGQKLERRIDMSTHLETLTKLRTEANRMGATVTDVDMKTIILGSLPPLDFGPSLMAMQAMSAPDLQINLLSYHDVRYVQEIADAKKGGVTM